MNVDIIDCRMTSYVASQFYIHSLLRINTEVPYKYSKEILCVSIWFLCLSDIETAGIKIKIFTKLISKPHIK